MLVDTRGARGRIVVMFDTLDIDPEATTRWKPMRSDTAMDIVVDSPIELQLNSAVLEITGPDLAPVIVDHRDFVAEIGPGGAFRYRVQWDGPWTRSDGTRLPAGNYKAIVRGTPVGATWEMESQPYDRISLVEVKEVKLEYAHGGPLEDNPNIGGGLRIFAEAMEPADVNPQAEIFDKVKVTATIEPEMPDAATLPVPITVSFRSLDVDDPADAPIDTTHR
jgi:hypothetical protein